MQAGSAGYMFFSKDPFELHLYLFLILKHIFQNFSHNAENETKACRLCLKEKCNSVKHRVGAPCKTNLKRDK